MADIKLLDEVRNPEKPRAIPGGNKRPSLRANLRAFPQVRRRQELNLMLLANGCGNGGTTNVKLRPKDLLLLVLIAEERGSNTNPLLRRAAITALSQFRELDAAAALARLARSELEHQSVRISALTALRTLSPDLAFGIDVGYRKAETKPARKGTRGAPPQDKR
jgi:hypothetical protein